MLTKVAQIRIQIRFTFYSLSKKWKSRMRVGRDFLGIETTPYFCVNNLKYTEKHLSNFHLNISYLP